MEDRIGCRKADGSREWPKFDVMGRLYQKPAHTVRGIGGRPAAKVRNTHFVVIPAGIAGDLIEAAVAEVAEWLSKQKEVRSVSGKEKASG